MMLKELIIELSHNCNLHCKMCGFWQDGFDKRKFMDFGLFKRIIDELGSSAGAIRLNGRGESTIHPHFLEMLDYCRKAHPKVEINLFTNISFKKDRILERFILDDIQLFISMDSPVKAELEEIRAGCDYDNLIQNIHGLSKCRKRPFIIFTIQEENLHRLKEIGEFALNNKMGIIYNTVRRDEGIQELLKMIGRDKKRIISDIEGIRELYRPSGLQCLIPAQIGGIALGLPRTVVDITYGQKERCPALESELCILYNGDVTPCNMFNPFVFGNIVKDGIDGTLNGPMRKKFIETHKSHYYCSNCACLGGTA